MSIRLVFHEYVYENIEQIPMETRKVAPARRPHSKKGLTKKSKHWMKLCMAKKACNDNAFIEAEASESVE